MHDADGVSVLVGEKLHDVVTLRHLVVRHFGPAHHGVFKDAFIDECLNVGDLLGCQRLTVEIERQFVRANIGTFLRYVGAGDLVERPVKQVRDRVVTLDGGAVSGVHSQLSCSTLLWRAVAFHIMQKRVTGLLRVGNLPSATADGKRTGVAHLTSHLGIKRGAIQDDAGAFLFFDHLEHGSIGVELVEPDEFSLCVGRKAGNADDLLLLGGARAFALLLH